MSQRPARRRPHLPRTSQHNLPTHHPVTAKATEQPWRRRAHQSSRSSVRRMPVSQPCSTPSPVQKPKWATGRARPSQCLAVHGKSRRTSTALSITQTSATSTRVPFRPIRRMHALTAPASTRNRRQKNRQRVDTTPRRHMARAKQSITSSIFRVLTLLTR